MRSYRNFLFDFDLTLADSRNGITGCFSHVLRSHGYHDVTREAICRTIGKPLEESFSILTGCRDQKTLESLTKEYIAQADMSMTEGTVFYRDALSCLRYLRSKHAGIGILSTKYRYMIQSVLDRDLPEGGLVDIIIGIEDVPRPKPFEDGILMALSRMGWEKEETVYIGDSCVDGQTAINGGLDFAGILHGVTRPDELEKYPHVALMQSLEELNEWVIRK